MTLENPLMLHQSSDLCHWLDHKLTPEVRALLCAMASRAPIGGIRARYSQLVHAVAKSLWAKICEDNPDEDLPNWAGALEARDEFTVDETLGHAERALCTYPLHPVVQEFFDKNVAQYGHSSPLELVGSPAVYIEGVSWYAQWLLFDSPLCAGQEFSTRAVRHKDWPMCREAMQPVLGETLSWVPNSALEVLHNQWFTVFEAEVDAWRTEFQKPCENCDDGEEPGCGVCAGTGMKYPWIKDPQAFRPALDRARCTVPGTFATGGSQTGNIRTMDRVVKIGQQLARDSASVAAISVWDNVAQVYRDALPGMANMGHREAVYETKEALIPGHLAPGFVSQKDADVGISIIVDHELMERPEDLSSYIPDGPKCYLDPLWNQLIQVRFHVQCSLAVARDWHRHRSAYPWSMRLVREENPDGSNGPIVMHPAYNQISQVGKENTARLLEMSGRTYDAFAVKGDDYRAMLTLPLGACVEMRASGGLRDMIYMLKLRKHSNGACFEYETQATAALALLEGELKKLARQYPGMMQFIGDVS